MNILFGSQGRGLDMFHALSLEMARLQPDLRAAFYVADSLHFGRYRRDRPEIDSAPLLKEWEIMATARGRQSDPAVLAEFDRRYGDPTLWNAVHADRRLIYGPRSGLRQDYRRRFDDDRLRAILQTAVESIEGFFDRVKPDLVITFICVTFGEYLLYLVAKKRGIPFFNLRTTRVRSFVTYGLSVFEPAEPIQAQYERYMVSGEDDQWTAEAARHIDFVRAHDARYEGVVASESPSPAKDRALTRLARAIRTEREYLTGPARHDNHVHDPLLTALYTNVFNPWRGALIRRRIGGQWVAASDLPQLRYGLYPLHTEPEVALLVYGRPYVNQIEVVRAIARSLPLDMTLLVKDHPAGLGMRSIGFYQALLNIPNVRLLNTACPSRVAVEHAALVITIGGSMGLEAAIRRKPVLILGQTGYQMLPETMVRHVAGLKSLPDDVSNALRTLVTNERALVSYVAAVMRESVAVNLYSDLLGRGGVFTTPQLAGHVDTRPVQALAEYTRSRWQAMRRRSVAESGDTVPPVRATVAGLSP